MRQENYPSLLQIGIELLEYNEITGHLKFTKELIKFAIRVGIGNLL